MGAWSPVNIENFMLAKDSFHIDPGCKTTLCQRVVAFVQDFMVPSPGWTFNVVQIRSQQPWWGWRANP
jgi:hypothetical protein